MSIQAEGREGETWARSWLKARGFELFQADWIARTSKGAHFVVEVKHQEMFEPPPFFGHGLPAWQVRSRLRFQEETGIRTLLLIRDKSTDAAYYQWLDNLDSGEHFDTRGASPRRVYPLGAFQEAVA